MGLEVAIGVGERVGLGVKTGAGVGRGDGAGFELENTRLGQVGKSGCFGAKHLGEKPWRRQMGNTMLKIRAEINIESQTLS